MLFVVTKFLLNLPITKTYDYGTDIGFKQTIHLCRLSDVDGWQSLLDYAGIMIDLEKLLRKKVDLLTEGGIMKFAKESIEQDKVLVYERAS